MSHANILRVILIIISIFATEKWLQFYNLTSGWQPLTDYADRGSTTFTDRDGFFFFLKNSAFTDILKITLLQHIYFHLQEQTPGYVMFMPVTSGQVHFLKFHSNLFIVELFC